MLGVSCSSVIKDEIPKNNNDTIKDVGLLKIPEDTIDTLQEWNEIRSTLENTRKDISKILISVQVMDLNGKIKVIHSSDIKFSYRDCDLDKKYLEKALVG